MSPKSLSEWAHSKGWTAAIYPNGEGQRLLLYRYWVMSQDKNGLTKRSGEHVKVTYDACGFIQNVEAYRHADQNPFEVPSSSPWWQKFYEEKAMIPSKFEVMFVSGYLVCFVAMIILGTLFKFPLLGFILSVLVLNLVYYVVLNIWVNWYKKRCIDRAIARLESVRHKP